MSDRLKAPDHPVRATHEDGRSSDGTARSGEGAGGDGDGGGQGRGPEGPGEAGRVQAKRAADAILRDLGAAVYAQRTGRATAGDARPTSTG